MAALVSSSQTSWQTTFQMDSAPVRAREWLKHRPGKTNLQKWVKYSSDPSKKDKYRLLVKACIESLIDHVQRSSHAGDASKVYKLQQLAKEQGWEDIVTLVSEKLPNAFALDHPPDCFSQWLKCTMGKNYAGKLQKYDPQADPTHKEKAEKHLTGFIFHVFADIHTYSLHLDSAAIQYLHTVKEMCVVNDMTRISAQIEAFFTLSRL
jgi:hypothetical protein